MKQITLPTLYSRTSTGAVQQWSVEVDGDKYRVVSGQKDSPNKVISEWTVVEGKNLGRKNATTPEQQALAEATSKWTKKARMGYTDNVTEIDTCTSYVEPMLAAKFKDRVKKIDWKRGVLVQTKYNGHRCTVRMEAGKIVAKTRTGKKYSRVVNHIIEDLKAWFAEFPDSVLDGEFYNYDLRTRLNDISSILRKDEDATDADVAEGKKLIRYYIYDGYRADTDGMDEESSYTIRKAWLDKMINKHTSFCRKVESDLIHSLAELDVIYNRYLADEEEGAIVRIPDSPYEHKRSNYLLKHKPVDSDECVIKALHEGTGNWAGTAKTATVVWKGKTFDATFKGSYALGAERLKNPEPWIEAKVTFLFNGLTGLGVPNYARIDPLNCFEGDK